MPSNSLTRALLVGLLLLVSSSLVSAGAAGAAGAVVAGSWTSLGPDGGSVSVLASPAGNPKIVYAGVVGGVYKSVDGGATWNRADRGSDLDPVAPVLMLAIDPLHPSTLYAGQLAGLFKSVDGGATWSQIRLGKLQFITSLAIHPRFPETVFLGTELGLYESSNGGARWRLLTRGLPPAPSVALAVAIDPMSPRRMFASFLELPSFQPVLFSSLDGGASWQQVQSDLPTIWFLAFDPRSPKSLWAATQNSLFRSTNDGRSWTRADQVFGPIVTLAFPPRQKNLIYAGGVAGLFRSLDGGATWSSLSQGLPSKVAVGSLLASATRATTLIVGVSYPPRDAGLYKSTNGGTSWTRGERGLTNSYVDSLAIGPEESNTLWVASQSDLFKSTDRGRTWSPSLLPPEIRTDIYRSAFRVIISPFDPETVYLGLIGGQFWRSRDGGQNWVMASPVGPTAEVLKADPLDAATIWAGGSGGLKKSTDRGDTWTPLPLPAAAAFGNVYDLAFSPSSPSTVYVNGTAGYLGLGVLLLRSEDAGATWTAAQGGLPAGITTLAVDPQHPETVYTVTFSGDVYKTVNGGSTWSLVTNAFHQRIVALLAASPSGVLYAAVQGDNVYESEDGGLSWAPLGEGPRPVYFKSLTADPKDPCRVYARTLNQGLLAFTKRGAAVCP